MAQHGIILLLFGPVLPEIMKTFEIGESLAGLMLGLGSLGFMAAPILAGTIADRRGVRWSLLLGLIVEIGFLTLLGFSPFLWLATAAIMILKFGAGFIETSLNVIPTLVRNERPGSLMNLVHMFFSVGALASPIIAGAILQATGSWRPVFWIAAAPTVLLLLAALRTRFPSNGHSGKLPSAGAAKSAMRAILRNRSVLLGAAVLFLYVGAEIAVSDWIVLYLQKKLAFGTLASTLGLSILWLGILAGRYLNSRLARQLSGKKLVLGAGALGLVSGLILLAVRTPVPAYLLLFVDGVAMSGIFPIVMAELNHRDPSLSGRVTGVLAVAASLGAVVFVPIVGAVAEWLGLTSALAIPAVLMGALGLLYLRVDEA